MPSAMDGEIATVIIDDENVKRLEWLRWAVGIGKLSEDQLPGRINTLPIMVTRSFVNEAEIVNAKSTN